MVHYGIHQPTYGKPHPGAKPLLLRDPPDRSPAGGQDDYAAGAGEEGEHWPSLRDAGRSHRAGHGEERSRPVSAASSAAGADRRGAVRPGAFHLYQDPH